MWFETWDFEEDPYGIKRTQLLNSKRIIWNRDDLENKPNVDSFIDNVANGRSVSLRIFGPSRSGKTWLLKYIEKSLKERMNNDVLVIMAPIPESDSNLDSWYRYFISSIEFNMDSFLAKASAKAGQTQGDWRKYFGDHELGYALWHISKKSDQKFIAMEWLRGEKLSGPQLTEAGLVSSLTKYKKVQIMIKLIDSIRLLYQSCVLMVDEIGLIRPPSNARVIGGILKDILDSFYERFGLICTYTADLSDTLIDLGYSQHFYKRFDFEVDMSAIHVEYMPLFVRKHNEAYRRSDSKIGDQLLPFTEEAIEALLELISFENYYPGPILHCCGILAAEATKNELKLINGDFVRANRGLLPKNYLRPS
jgi:hypothetical protein